MDGADKVAGRAGMSAFAGKASGAVHGQRRLKGLKNCRPIRRVGPKTQEIEADGYLPWLVSNYSDHP